MNVPKELLYTKSHEWVKKLDDGSVLVGLSDKAQSDLGDLVFVNLPAVGDSFAAEDTLCDVESVKAVSDVYAPAGRSRISRRSVLRVAISAGRTSSGHGRCAVTGILPATSILPPRRRPCSTG